MPKDSPISDLLVNLPARHRSALQWFEAHAGEVVPWPKPLPDGTLLAIKPKGIYKPEWSEFALSVRHSLSGPYPDRDVVEEPDGLWKIEYFQEGFNPEDKEALFTNRGLMNCWKSVVPVGVLYQVKQKPDPRYKVLGLALVDGFEDGYFSFQGIGRLSVRDPGVHSNTVPTLKTPQERANHVGEIFDPRLVDDQRKVLLGAIKRRQGQGLFRTEVMRAYRHRCSITGYDADEALEAAHILPYRGPVTNHPTNGLLLRADIHTLFDLGLLAVDFRSSEDCLVVLDRDLMGSKYRELAGVRLRLPEDMNLRPSEAALKIHRAQSGL